MSRGEARFAKATGVRAAFQAVGSMLCWQIECEWKRSRPSGSVDLYTDLIPTVLAYHDLYPRIADQPNNESIFSTWSKWKNADSSTAFASGKLEVASAILDWAVNNNVLEEDLAQEYRDYFSLLGRIGEGGIGPDSEEVSRRNYFSRGGFEESVRVDELVAGGRTLILSVLAFSLEIDFSTRNADEELELTLEGLEADARALRAHLFAHGISGRPHNSPASDNELDLSRMEMKKGNMLSHGDFIHNLELSAGRASLEIELLVAKFAKARDILEGFSDFSKFEDDLVKNLLIDSFRDRARGLVLDVILVMERIYQPRENAVVHAKSALQSLVDIVREDHRHASSKRSD